MKHIKNILNAAAKQGACKLIDGINSYDAAVRLLFSPQGREFAKMQGIPTLEQLRSLPTMTHNGIYTDCGAITLASNGKVCVAGDTSATIYVADNTKLHTILVMHGATAHVVADNYSVVDVTIIGGSATSETHNHAKIVQL